MVFDDLKKIDKSKGEKRKANGSTMKLALEELIREEGKKKEKINREDCWLCEGMVVKVMRKGLVKKGYYVSKDTDKYFGEIKILE